MIEKNWSHGPWTLEETTVTPDIFQSNGEKVASIAVRGSNNFATLLEEEANAYLIAAAPTGFEAAETAYIAILQSPLNSWRIEQGMNGVLSGLRDYLAMALDIDAQLVQEHYETIVRKRSQQANDYAK